LSVRFPREAGVTGFSRVRHADAPPFRPFDPIGRSGTRNAHGVGLRRAAALVLLLTVASCRGASTAAHIPTAEMGRVDPSVMNEPSQVVERLRVLCVRRVGAVRLDLRQGDTRLRHVFRCAMVRDDAAGTAAALVNLVHDRHHAARRAALITTLVRAWRLHPYSRSEAIWEIGTGSADIGCVRATDVTFHREEMDVSARMNHETPEHWTRVEAARLAGTCPKGLSAFLSSLTNDGVTAAATVRAELVQRGVLPS
jgi:hypothetical protein